MNLNFVHSCDKKSFLSILRNQEIQTNLCNLANQHLIYSYWGIPNFKIRDDNNLKYSELRPVCFILNFDKIKQKIHKIHKTDSGFILNSNLRLKLLSESLNEYINKNFGNLTPFEFSKHDLNEIDTHIQNYFRDNLSYWDSKLDHTNSNFSLYQFYKSISDFISNELQHERDLGKLLDFVDNRVLTIEAMFNSNIPLSCVEAIIYPETFDPMIVELKSKSPIKLIDYHDYDGERWQYFHMLLKDKTRDYFRGRL